MENRKNEVEQGSSEIAISGSGMPVFFWAATSIGDTVVLTFTGFPAIEDGTSSSLSQTEIIAEFMRTATSVGPRPIVIDFSRADFLPGGFVRQFILFHRERHADGGVRLVLKGELLQGWRPHIQRMIPLFADATSALREIESKSLD